MPPLPADRSPRCRRQIEAAAALIGAFALVSPAWADSFQAAWARMDYATAEAILLHTPPTPPTPNRRLAIAETAYNAGDYALARSQVASLRTVSGLTADQRGRLNRVSSRLSQFAGGYTIESKGGYGVDSAEADEPAPARGAPRAPPPPIEQAGPID